MKRRIKFIFIITPLLICALAVRLCRSNPSSRMQKIPAATETEQQQWLSEQGLQTEKISVQEVTIPHDLGENYMNYAALQEHQMLPLSEHAGSRAECITYEITNAASQMYAELLVADGILIGAQCYAPENGVTLTMQGTPYTASSDTAELT
ncbi:MAG: DUF4830 domain-containing protein [Ruminococcus sp.]|nr:DUF4830 domain-containing protein [Ruminococcus sp.]